MPSTPLHPAFTSTRRFGGRWSVLVGLAALLVSLSTGYAEPRDDWSLEARLPQSTLGVISIESVDALEQRFDKTAIAGLFREPEMKAFMAPIEKAGEEMLEAGEDGPMGEAGPMIMKVLEQLKGLKGQIAVAVLDVDLEGEQPMVAASMDFGPNVADFITFVQTMRAELDPEGEAVREYEKDGRIWWQIKDGPPFTATTVDTAFVVATDETVLEGIIAGVGPENLAASAHFQDVRTKSGGDDLALFAFANVPAIVQLFASEMDDESMRIANHLGLDTVKGVAYGMAFSGDGFMDSLIIHTPGADHGIVPLMSMPKFESRALPFAPANAFYFEEGSYDMAALLPRVRALVAGIEEDAAKELEEALEHINESVGVNIETELLAGLAGPMGAYGAMPETGGLYPEFAMMMQVKDAASFEGIMQRTATGIAGMVSEEGDVVASTRTLDYRGHKLHMLELQAARGDDPIPFTPTWTMIDDWCVLTLVPHAMKEIVLRREAGTGDGLAAQEDFQALRRVMPADAGAMGYLDLQGIMSLIYDTAVPTLQTIAKPNVLGREVPFPMDWAQLPAARTARPYFRSMGIFSSWTKDGMAVRMHGPLPVGGLMIMAGATAAVFLVSGESSHARAMPPGMMEDIRPVPVKPRRSSEARLAHLQGEQIASYVRVFVLTRQRLPKDLDELVSSEVMASLPTDPWGNDYVLGVIDAKAKKFVVNSSGPDGLFGTEDDVTSGE